jgi:carbon-monoxide dehydrogenase small subunit
MESELLPMKVSLTINGDEHVIDVEPRTLLVHALRDQCGLTGTKVGCDTSQCGACTVLVGPKAYKSCSLLAVSVGDVGVTTVEGLDQHADGRLLQEAFVEHHGFQCGFCTGGMLMASLDVLSRHDDPSEREIRESLAGNLCRCTGYDSIVRSVRAAANARAAA